MCPKLENQIVDFSTWAYTKYIYILALPFDMFFYINVKLQGLQKINMYQVLTYVRGGQ